MKYQFQEGSITLGTHYQDETVNIIRLTEQQATLVITRDVLKKEQTLEKYVENQLTALKKSVKKFVAEPCQPVTLAEGRLTGYETACEFEKNGTKIVQRMVMFQQQQKIVVINYTLLHRFTPENIAFWQAIKQSYQPVFTETIES